MRKPIVWTLALAMCVSALPAMAGWDEGVAAFTSKNYQVAAQHFQELVDAQPDGYRGHYMLGLSLQQLSRKEEALHHLRKAYDLNPNDLNTKLALGRAYYNLRRYADVSKLLGGVDASSLPGAQQAAFYQMRGESKLRNNDESGAVGDFKKLASLRSNDAKTQYLYGTTALRAGQQQAGLDALDRASRLAPNDAEIKRTYINALIKQARMTRDKNGKRTTYMRAVSLAKELVGAKNDFDNCMLLLSAELGAALYADASGTGAQCVAKKDGDWLPHFYLGQALSSDGKFAQAEGPLLDAKERANQPNDLKQVWRQLGFVYEKQKKYTQSIEAYQSAGDQGGVARVQENEATARENNAIEAENARIRQMEEEARKLEEELKALEGGGGRR